MGLITSSKWPKTNIFLLKLISLSSVPLSSVCSIAHLNLSFLLASLRYGFFFAIQPRRPASRSRLFTIDVETGVLRVLFNEAASWELVRCLFLKLDSLMYLTSCPVVHRGLLLLFLFWLEFASSRCSVKGVVHSVVRDIQFLGNFSHGIAFISQNKNRLRSFRRNFFVSRHFEPVIEPTNADAPDTQLV